LEINWSNQAIKQLDIALDFLVEKGFASYAFELNEQILLRIENLPENYNIYPTDKYKKINNGNFRAFEIDDYRISYRITKTAIKIIRIRHTSRRTRKY
jgi:mRNA-degrading endonuclease RelE of RelBE toxin-antitoxin system